MSKPALIIGGSIAGLQAALDLADSGIKVYLVDSSPFLGKEKKQIIPWHLLNSRMLEVERHPNICLWTNSHLNLTHSNDKDDWFNTEIIHNPRYIDLDKCTGCGECMLVCPVTVQGTNRKAIFMEGQPGCVAIEKLGIAPCRDACPTHQRAQGYIALVRQKRYADAYWAIRREHPFPSVCGRVCNHRCEDVCTRGRVDEPVNIMGIKRFVSDWAFAHQDDLQNLHDKSLIGTPFQHKQMLTGKRIAVIGAGPAGLTAALDLVRLGYSVTVFDTLPVAGGMMRVGIPPHRLPDELLDWEIGQIINEGVELELNTRVDDIPGLLEDGFDAVLIATGAHKAKKLPLRHSNHPDNWLSLDVLRRTRLGEKIELRGKKVVVLGGGNVALDTARTVLRLGADEVSIACLESRGEMPGFSWEISVAEEEGILMFPGRTFKEIVVEDDKIIGVQCAEIDFHGFKAGRPVFDEIPDTDHLLSADLIIWAIGQEPNFSFLPQDGSINTRYPVGIQSDDTMMTTLPGVFVAGDVHRGVTFFVVDAISEGHNAAINIDNYLRDGKGIHKSLLPPVVELNQDQIKDRLGNGELSRHARIPIRCIPIEERDQNFREVDLTLTEEEVLIEAGRCLRCAICSECLECLSVCKHQAIDHDMREERIDLNIGAVIYATETDQINQDNLSKFDRFYSIPPDDALLGSSTAAKIMVDLIAERQPLPLAVSSIEISDDTRIGIFLCECGGEISKVVDLERVSDRFIKRDDILNSQILPNSCSPEAIRTIRSVIKDYDLNRVVIAACTCCPMAQVCYSCTYQRVRCKQNLGLYSSIQQASNGINVAQMVRLEFVNIREQCAWVHPEDPKTATEKARGMVEAAVGRVKVAPIRLANAHRINKTVLILGSGKAAQFCLDNLSNQGVDVEFIDHEITEVGRADGQFFVIHDDRSWSASALVISPDDQQESNRLIEKFGRERRRPLVHSAWGGLETHRPGVYLCDPNQPAETVGLAAAARVVAWLYRMENRPPIAAVVDPDRCRACKTCVDICEFGAPELVKSEFHYQAWIDPAICTGCGTCAAHCPLGAISAGCSTDAQLEAMLKAFLSHPLEMLG